MYTLVYITVYNNYVNIKQYSNLYIRRVINMPKTDLRSLKTRECQS